MEEIWKPIENYEKYYEISNFENVRSKDRIRRNGKGTYLQKGRILHPNKDGFGYLTVTLWANAKSKRFKIHQLVAKYFLNDTPKECINHIDGNKENNKVDNLEWCSYSYNNRHAYINGLKTGCFKKINQFDKKKNFIMSWNGSLKIQDELKINHSNIIKCCNGKRKTAGGYIWEYGD